MELSQIKEKIYTGIDVKKPVRTISGVTPLTVVLKPRKCDHGTCIFCPGGDHVPQSYTDKSPAVMRAISLKYDPYEQVRYRLKVLKNMNHPTDKIELILLGGTFLQYEVDYQYWFIKRCYDALNERDSSDLNEAKRINETSQNRCVAMCIENRPDNCSVEEIKRMREFGATRVEIGIQILDDETYRRINRGHKIQDVIDATYRLKNAGFKIGYHVMPGLPFSNYEKDIEKFKLIFEDPNYRPDQLKIYPCQIVDDSPLAKIYKRIGYQPYDEKTTKKVVSEMIKLIPNYCRIMRIMREIPKEKMMTSPVKLDLRKDIEDDFKREGVKTSEIRMREIGFNTGKLNQDIELKISEYEASNGKEFFLEMVNKDNILFGLLRLRFPDKVDLKELKGCAIVRELHVYGQSLKLGEKGEKSQHKGYGKLLMLEGEKIAKAAGYKKIAVISGIGVREYYKRIGYELVGEYMVKRI